MAKDIDKSLGDQKTQNEAKPVESSQRSLGDRSTFGGDGGSSAMADLAGIGGDAGLEMEIVDLSTRYKIENVLGKGGMGEVLLATDTRLKRRVAIKRILGDASRNASALQRFLTEAQAIAALSHNNIVQVYDYGRDKDGPFLIIEYVDGGSLLDRCRQGAMPVEEAVELVCQLCDGLAKAHDAGIIHRDIKPANILITKDGVPKLTDFGLAKGDIADRGMTMTGAVLGTLDFMPPEQRMDAALTDARSDLWSLAATFYQMVTGESPKVIRLKKVPPQLQDWLDKALEESKENRYQTAREFKAALRGDSKSITTTAPFVDAAELGEGICPCCRTQNELQRRFCKRCAGALRVSCMQCEQEIPIWDQVCGSCGGKQPELIAAARAKIAHERLESAGNSIGIRLKLLPAGTFWMGEDLDAHKVTLTQPFYLGVYEVTQEQYERVMGKNPSNFKGPQNPVEKVSWDDAVEFCRKLSELPEEKAAGRIYRLPTEAEWEYACRAGTTTKYSFGDSESELGEYGWFDKNSDRKTHPVGQKQPNKWGLYDMHGNVWEWCSDWYG